MMLGVTAVAVLGLPVLVPLAVVRDLVRGRRRLPTVRTYLFVLQYLVNDSVEIVLAPALWLMAGAGTRLTSKASIRRHERLQWWSLRLLTKRAEDLLGLRVELADSDADVILLPTPVIVLCRHVSVFDASLPGLLYQERDVRVRGVVLAELLADPGFDLIYGRTGSVFISRRRGAAARAEIQRMTATADPNTAFVIFPEGRLFRPSIRASQLRALKRTDPERAVRMAELEHVLLPRSGGVLELLDALPEADVVVVTHQGLEERSQLADLLASAPLSEPIKVTVKRIARAAVPDDEPGRIRWLDEVWLDLDRQLKS